MTVQAAMVHTSEGVSFVIDNVPYDCDSTHPNYSSIMLAAQEERWADIPNLINIKNALIRYCGSSGDNIEVFDGYLTYNGNPVHNTLTERIIEMMGNGFNIDPMLRFMANLYQNPSDVAIAELYDFIERARLPITTDGHFIAYKRVRDNYMSVHDNKTPNAIGTTLKMDRDQCDPNRNNHCSTGFHFCSYNYLGSFAGDRVVLLKINPRDVVSIPNDYDFAKGRACQYTVVGEVCAETINNRDVLSETRIVVDDIPTDVPTSADFDSVPISEPDTNIKEEVADFIDGYLHGYKIGRQKRAIPRTELAEKSTDYNAAFNEGRSDARNGYPSKYQQPK